jgi:glycoside/pentoside/hexuronide:cation symporter, GPH family
LIFPSLLLLGRSAQNPMGVQATALAAVAFCLAGWWAFKKYR